MDISKNLTNANYIKALLIDYLIKDNDGKAILGTEISFGSKHRIADLVLLTDFLSVFEIKAMNDDLRNIRSQLNNYKKVFDYLYLVVTEKHFNKAKKIVTPNEGLILISPSGEVNIYKNAMLIKKHSKEEILDSITAEFLKKTLELPNEFSAYEVKNKLQKEKLITLKQFFKDFLIQKLANKNELLIKERGEITHYEDVAILSYNSDPHLTL